MTLLLRSIDLDHRIFEDGFDLVYCLLRTGHHGDVLEVASRRDASYGVPPFDSGRIPSLTSPCIFRGTMKRECLILMKVGSGAFPSTRAGARAA